MNRDLSELITLAFLRLRRRGFDVGIQEYLSALDIVEQEAVATLVTDLNAVKSALKLLWCSSRSQRSQFEPIWDEVVAATATLERPEAKEPLSQTDRLPQKSKPENVSPPEPINQLPAQIENLVEQQAAPEMAIQPVRAPFTPAEVEDSADLNAYWPISRRSMSYTWRYLRRPVAQGAATIFDVAATVQAVARDGFYLAPVLRCREQNQARLVLLIDQNGSMMPFHRFTRDLVETAKGDSSLREEQVAAYYFHNAPGDFVYRDAFLTQPIALSTILADLDSDASVLVVSDGGAARGYRRLDRIQNTTSFLLKLRRVTNLIAWLNPMPIDRWEGSSADIMANIVPMFQMDDDGLSNAIDIVRGQPIQHVHSPWL